MQRRTLLAFGGCQPGKRQFPWGGQGRSAGKKDRGEGTTRVGGFTGVLRGL